jgi:hypothetical protein
MTPVTYAVEKSVISEPKYQSVPLLLVNGQRLILPQLFVLLCVKVV